MATDFQYANFPISQDGTMGFKNTSGGTIASDTLVKLDASNPPDGNALGGVIPTAASTDFAIGITTESAADKGTIKVRLVSTSANPVTAKGAVTYGDLLMPGSTSGTASKQTTGKASFGVALNTAADGDPVLALLVGCAMNA